MYAWVNDDGIYYNSLVTTHRVHDISPILPHVVADTTHIMHCQPITSFIIHACIDQCYIIVYKKTLKTTCADARMRAKKLLPSRPRPLNSSHEKNTGKYIYIYFSLHSRTCARTIHGPFLRGREKRRVLLAHGRFLGIWILPAYYPFFLIVIPRFTSAFYISVK